MTLLKTLYLPAISIIIRIVVGFITNKIIAIYWTVEFGYFFADFSWHLLIRHSYLFHLTFRSV